MQTVIESEIVGNSPISRDSKIPSEKIPSEKITSEKIPSEKPPSEKSPSSIKQRRNLNINGQTLAMKSDVNNGVDLLLSSTEGLQNAKNELNFLPSSTKINSEHINEQNFVPSPKRIKHYASLGKMKVKKTKKNEANFVSSSTKNEEDMSGLIGYMGLYYILYNIFSI